MAFFFWTAFGETTRDGRWMAVLQVLGLGGIDTRIGITRIARRLGLVFQDEVRDAHEAHEGGRCRFIERKRGAQTRTQ